MLMHDCITSVTEEQKQQFFEGFQDKNNPEVFCYFSVVWIKAYKFIYYQDFVELSNDKKCEL